jgi:hypothetical protein
MNFVLSEKRCPNCQVPEDLDFSPDECREKRQKEMTFYIKSGNKYPEMQRAWLTSVNSVRRGEPVPCVDFQDRSF